MLNCIENASRRKGETKLHSKLRATHRASGAAAKKKHANGICKRRKSKGVSSELQHRYYFEVRQPRSTCMNSVAHGGVDDRSTLIYGRVSLSFKPSEAHGEIAIRSTPQPHRSSSPSSRTRCIFSAPISEEAQLEVLEVLCVIAVRRRAKRCRKVNCANEF